VSVAEPLDLDYEGKIVGRVDQERDQSLAVLAERQGAQGGGVGRFVGVALVFGGSTITTASMNCAKAFLAVWLKLADSRPRARPVPTGTRVRRPTARGAGRG